MSKDHDNDDDLEGRNQDAVRELVYECILTHNEEILISLLVRLEKEYIDIAKVATFGKYHPDWSHEETLNYITYET
tara:strand:+ start:384 stop:611 length:228 start_codon:yes stop_codon:yes gene_type:complete